MINLQNLNWYNPIKFQAYGHTRCCREKWDWWWYNEGAKVLVTKVYCWIVIIKNHKFYLSLKLRVCVYSSNFSASISVEGFEPVVTVKDMAHGVTLIPLDSHKFDLDVIQRLLHGTTGCNWEFIWKIQCSKQPFLISIRTKLYNFSKTHNEFYNKNLAKMATDWRLCLTKKCIAVIHYDPDSGRSVLCKLRLDPSCAVISWKKICYASMRDPKASHYKIIFGWQNDRFNSNIIQVWYILLFNRTVRLRKAPAWHNSNSQEKRADRARLLCSRRCSWVISWDHFPFHS